MERDEQRDIKNTMKSKLWETLVDMDTDNTTLAEDVEDAEYCAMMALGIESCEYTQKIGVACLRKAYPWLSEDMNEFIINFAGGLSAPAIKHYNNEMDY